MRKRQQILRMARPLFFLMAGAISLYPAIQPQYPFLQDSRQTPTSTSRVRITATRTLPPRLTNTSQPPAVHSTNTLIPPLQSASATPTAIIIQEITPSDTPTPTTQIQILDIATHEPTPEVPGSKQPEAPFNPASSKIPFVIAGVILGISSTILVVVTFGAGSGIIAAAVILAGALIGGAISSATGGDFWDGFMLGATIGAIPAAFTSFITNILRLLQKKKKRD